MKNFIWALFFCVILAVSTVSAQTDLCFKNKGLKLLQTVSFTVRGNKIEGTFNSSEYDESNAETFEFTGTKSGNLLTIKFKGTVPYELPPRTKRIVWTLGRSNLKIPTYGKDYTTNKFSAYTATYEKCSEI